MFHNRSVLLQIERSAACTASVFTIYNGERLIARTLRCTATGATADLRGSLNEYSPANGNHIASGRKAFNKLLLRQKTEKRNHLKAYYYR
jgi:hypothetical protein